jgi:hypothetical protein
VAGAGPHVINLLLSQLPSRRHALPPAARYSIRCSLSSHTTLSVSIMPTAVVTGVNSSLGHEFAKLLIREVCPFLVHLLG